MSASPYGSPQNGNYYATPESLPLDGSWSARTSTMGSPQRLVVSPHAIPRGLPAQAIMEMKRHILLPLSQDPALLQFTPLIQAASHRLDEGRIQCLRDLEKLLLFKSQELAPSPQSFMMFCEKFLLRCQSAIAPVQTAGGELTRQQDTPYYEGYFMDVLAQNREAIGTQIASAPAP